MFSQKAAASSGVGHDRAHADDRDGPVGVVLSSSDGHGVLSCVWVGRRVGTGRVGPVTRGGRARLGGRARRPRRPCRGSGRPGRAWMSLTPKRLRQLRQARGVGPARAHHEPHPLGGDALGGLAREDPRQRGEPVGVEAALGLVRQRPGRGPRGAAREGRPRPPRRRSARRGGTGRAGCASAGRPGPARAPRRARGGRGRRRRRRPSARSAWSRSSGARRVVVVRPAS